MAKKNARVIKLKPRKKHGVWSSEVATWVLVGILSGMLLLIIASV